MLIVRKQNTHMRVNAYVRVYMHVRTCDARNMLNKKILYLVIDKFQDVLYNKLVNEKNGLKNIQVSEV